MGIKRRVPGDRWNGAECLGKSNPVCRILCLGFSYPDSVAMRPIMIWPCLENKSGSTRWVVLKHVTIVNGRQYCCVRDCRGVLQFGDHIINCMAYASFLRCPSITSKWSKTGDCMCSAKLRSCLVVAVFLMSCCCFLMIWLEYQGVVLGLSTTQLRRMKSKINRLFIYNLKK